DADCLVHFLPSSSFPLSPSPLPPPPPPSSFFKSGAQLCVCVCVCIFIWHSSVTLDRVQERSGETWNGSAVVREQRRTPADPPGEKVRHQPLSVLR
uniref:Uncharacterized protein n=1 Tax=Denticeps clupeoides TaxID=299321 RepID=A0AAY4ATN7_9TELE